MPSTHNPRCPIYENSSDRSRKGDWNIEVRCPRCGLLVISRECNEDLREMNTLKRPEDRALVSHVARQGQGKRPLELNG